MFWSVMGSGFGEPVAYPLPPLHHQEPSGVPRGIFVVSSLTFFLSAEAAATRESPLLFSWQNWCNVGFPSTKVESSQKCRALFIHGWVPLEGKAQGDYSRCSDRGDSTVIWADSSDKKERHKTTVDSTWWQCSSMLLLTFFVHVVYRIYSNKRPTSN